jgi:hypothetical protein
MGYVLLGNDVRCEGPPQRLPERDRGGRDGSGAVERELSGLLPGVGQVPVRLLPSVLVRKFLVRNFLVRSLAGRLGVHGVLVRSVLVRRNVRVPEAVSSTVSKAVSTAVSEAVSNAVPEAVFTAVSARGGGSAAVRGRRRHAPEASAAA